MNGKNATRNTLKINCFRCLGACLSGVTTVVISNTTKLWSDHTQWPNGTLPKAGDDVLINPGDNWVYDLAMSPVYNNVQINGLVTFKQDAPTL